MIGRKIISLFSICTDAGEEHKWGINVKKKMTAQIWGSGGNDGVLAVHVLGLSLNNYRNATRSDFNAVVVKGNVSSLMQPTSPIF